MINNLSKIRNYIKFESTDDFYFLQLVYRRIDTTNGDMLFPNKPGSYLRTKTYYIKSLAEIDRTMVEVIQICNECKTRAYLHLNKRSFEDMSNAVRIQTYKLTVPSRSGIVMKEHNIINKLPYLYETVAELSTSESSENKKWIIDVDNGDISIAEEVRLFLNNDSAILLSGGTGYHIVTPPFDKATFTVRYPDYNIFENSGIVLYMPDI
jgi:hypothetical protein